MTPPVRVTAPAVKPVTVENVRREAHIYHLEDDDRLEMMIDAAVSYLDGWSGVLGRCIISQQWRQTFDDWAPSLRLPFPDVSGVTLTYIDADGATQTVSADEYAVVETPVTAELHFWPTFAQPALRENAANRITATFTAGYGATGAAVPARLRLEIIRLAAYWYDKPDDEPPGFSRGIAPYRRGRV